MREKEAYGSIEEVGVVTAFLFERKKVSSLSQVSAARKENEPSAA